jgi:hypothetical protein
MYCFPASGHGRQHASELLRERFIGVDKRAAARLLVPVVPHLVFELEQRAAADEKADELPHFGGESDGDNGVFVFGLPGWWRCRWVVSVADEDECFVQEVDRCQEAEQSEGCSRAGLQDSH